eukprot:TRINITY_DN2796_c0_g3_i5.p2 TRINITY_DN2796_c0_g3~~TRINITY_DN2796_c0_g3_i5.p2  ORF type:complete len:151 (+),score=16.13 TRINITY_DN2796_c0_g3_i5:531-983(+)
MEVNTSSDETLVKEILNSQCESTSRVELLNKFNSKHAGTASFSNLFPTSLKKELIHNLYAHGVQSSNIEEVALSFSVMRLLAREVDGAEELFCDEGLDFVSKFAFPSNKIKEKFSIQIESAKCLVNLVFKSSALNVAMRNPEKYRAYVSI